MSALPDDHKVVVTGQLVRSLGHERYEVKDHTGSIVVEIDDEDWRGQPVYAGQTVRIDGEVDRHDGRAVEIEADSVMILSAPK
ncbi:NirD/YgiW/YdeI family stress tolerance protein [Neisseriaceae bacterium ESL0693]|nr:NirD/YgiW/YdeI family stress tolerance protein [Neisseriaceae bacterium ESL0693]